MTLRVGSRVFMRSSLALLWGLTSVGRSLVHAEELGVNLLAEPTEFTDVIDGFDGDAAMDVNLRLGFSRTRAVGTIQREQRGEGTDHGSFVDIAEHEAVTNRLMLGVDVGLYRDLMVFGRLPLILSDERRLRAPEGRLAQDVNEDLAAPVPAGYDGMPGDAALFEVPFGSPTRSGVDWVSVGVAWAITNQYRSPDLPTWVLLAEGRFGVGSLLTPCATRSPDSDGADTGQHCENGGSPGISRGTHTLRLESRVSKRFRYLEPYLGTAFQMEWAGRARERFSPGDDMEGATQRHPPTMLELTAGAALIPWEDRGRHQRFAVDVRGTAAYLSQGRDYTPLFDALGTSRNPYLTAPNYARIPAPGEATPAAVHFAGLTDVSARARLGLRTSVIMKAARYVQFAMGVGVFYDTPYLLSGSDACNAQVSSSDSGRTAGCTRGIINPQHREVIDAPGQRFRLDGQVMLDLFASGMAQF